MCGPMVHTHLVFNATWSVYPSTCNLGRANQELITYILLFENRSVTLVVAMTVIGTLTNTELLSGPGNLSFEGKKRNDVPPPCVATYIGFETMTS